MTKLLVMSSDYKVSEAVSQLRGYEIVSVAPATMSDVYDITVALLDADHRNFAADFTTLEKTCRVVVLVAEDKQRILSDYLKRNLADYLVKPVNTDALQWRLDRVVGESMLKTTLLQFRNEVNHPLSPIQGWIDLILQGVDQNLPQDMVRRWVNLVKNNTLRAEAVVNKHVDFVRLFSGQLDVYPLKLIDIIAPLIEKARASHSSNNFILTLPEDLPAVLTSDSFIRFILDTLLVYVVPETRVEIVAVCQEPANRVILSIRPDRLKGSGWREVLQYMVRKHRVTLVVEGKVMHFTFPVVPAK